MQFVEKKIAHRSFSFAHIEQTASTNTDLLNRCRTSLLSAPLVLWTDRQTMGRGTRGREWKMPLDALLFSVAVPLSYPLQKYVGVSLTVGVKIVQFLRKQGVEATLKWPNDIFVNERKLAGILIENVKNAQGCNVLVIGVGLNLKLSDLNLNDYQACSIADFVDCEWNIDRKSQWVDALIDCIFDAIEEIQNVGLNKTVLVWPTVAAYQNEPIDLVQEGEIVCSAVQRGIDESGRLLVSTPDGTRAFISGTISLRKK